MEEGWATGKIITGYYALTCNQGFAFTMLLFWKKFLK
jgi:hypothetical protein